MPAAAMISIAACWSRMFSRLIFVGNEPLDDRERDEQRHERERRSRSLRRRLRPTRRRFELARAAGRAALIGGRSIPSANAAARMAGSVICVARELAHEAARAHHEHAVREAQDLLDLGGDQQHPEALARPATTSRS